MDTGRECKASCAPAPHFDVHQGLWSDTEIISSTITSLQTTKAIHAQHAGGFSATLYLSSCLKLFAFSSLSCKAFPSLPRPGDGVWSGCCLGPYLELFTRGKEGKTCLCEIGAEREGGPGWDLSRDPRTGGEGLHSLVLRRTWTGSWNRCFQLGG